MHKNKKFKIVLLLGVLLLVALKIKIILKFFLFLFLFLIALIFLKKPVENLSELVFPHTHVFITYEGDCGATCTYGDIIVRKKRDSFLSRKREILRISETSPDGFTFIKNSDGNLEVSRPAFDTEYCRSHAEEDFCEAKKYVLEISK